MYGIGIAKRVFISSVVHVSIINMCSGKPQMVHNIFLKEFHVFMMVYAMKYNFEITQEFRLDSFLFHVKQ